MSDKDWNIRNDLSVLISRIIVEKFKITENLEKNINTISYVAADLLIDLIGANQ